MRGAPASPCVNLPQNLVHIPPARSRTASLNTLWVCDLRHAGELLSRAGACNWCPTGRASHWPSPAARVSAAPPPTFLQAICCHARPDDTVGGSSGPGNAAAGQRCQWPADTGGGPSSRADRRRSDGSDTASKRAARSAQPLCGRAGRSPPRRKPRPQPQRGCSSASAGWRLGWRSGQQQWLSSFTCGCHSQ